MTNEIPKRLRAPAMKREEVRSAMTGLTISISPHEEPLVQPGEKKEGQFITPWVLYAHGRTLNEPYDQYHPMRSFLVREDAVLIHDQIMGGLAWRWAVTAEIQRD